MKKSVLSLIQQLEKKLLEYPTLVHSLEKKSPYFIDLLLQWIRETEDILTTHSISEVSALSGYRAKILSTEFIETVKLTAKKNERRKIAAECMYDIQSVVTDVLTPKRNAVDECRQLLRQLLNIISQNNIIKYDSKEPFEDFINDIWNFILAHDQLKPGAVKLKTVLPLNDIRLLIAEEINLEDFQ